MKKAVLTLASSGESCLIDPDIVLFALRMDGDTEDKEPFRFSRVFLKTLTFESGDNWVDVKETIDEIRRKCK